MNELEALVRDTLRAKADTVTETRAGNELTGRPARRWLPAVAAAILVLALGGGTALWRLNDSGTHHAGAPSVATTVGSCPATLPAAWRTALTGRPVTAPGGGVAVPAAMSPDARTIVTWKHTGRSWTGVIAAGGRAVRPLYEVPADRDVASIDVDAHTLVLSEIDHARASYGGPITAVVTVDLDTGRAMTILRPGPGRALASTTGTAVFIQDGVVYWSLLRTGSPSGTVQAYDLRTGTTRVVGHTAGQHPTLDRDVRGVTWNGGTVANPQGSPAAAAAADRVVGDGGAVAWQPDARMVRGVLHNGQRVRWADGHTTRTVTVRGLTDPDIALVSGPLVLLGAPSSRPLVDGDAATMQLLDVRTGALAPIVVPSGAQLGAAGHWAFTTGTGVLLVATRTLPGLQC
jgi:hypothetical protein